MEFKETRGRNPKPATAKLIEFLETAEPGDFYETAGITAQAARHTIKKNCIYNFVIQTKKNGNLLIYIKL